MKLELQKTIRLLKWRCLLFLAMGMMLYSEEGILIKSGQKVAFMGDSITANGWNFPGGYVRLIVNGLEKEGIKIESISAGVSGHTSKDMLARLDKDILSKNPNWLILSCGVNDVWHGSKGVPLDVYKANITSIIDQAQAKGIKIILLTSTPIGEEDNNNNKKLAAYNDFLRQLSKDRRFPAADLNADFQTVLRNLQTSPQSRNLTVDGIHMNPEGNVLMAKGCLLAMGVSAEEIKKIEQNWVNQSELAYVPVNPYDPKFNIKITLGEYRQLRKVAEGLKTNCMELGSDLWMRAYSEGI
ncbi:MAG: SGNH/GDSL hydrolase family protein, partial [Verrucomicrobiota bacterium]